LRSDIASLVQRITSEAAQREERMRSDPEYRLAEERRLEAEERRRMETAENERRMDVERRRRQADVPPRLWPLLDRGLDSEAAKAVDDWLATGRTFLVLAGQIGCGKTAAACSAIDLRGGRFVKASAVTRARFDDTAWLRTLEARTLVVDDLGTEPLDAKGWAAGALAELFDSRYDWERPTILTTNLDADSFRARYCDQDGGRFLSRLREVGRFVVVAQGSLREGT